MEREFKFLPAVISLTAGLVISIVIIANGASSLTSLIIVLCFLLGFYILGLIFRAILIRFKTKKKEPEIETADTDNDESEKPEDNQVQ